MAASPVLAQAHYAERARGPHRSPDLFATLPLYRQHTIGIDYWWLSVRELDEFLAERWARPGTCMQGGDGTHRYGKSVVPTEAAAGTDDLWHLLHPGTGDPLCRPGQHGPAAGRWRAHPTGHDASLISPVRRKSAIDVLARRRCVGTNSKSTVGFWPCQGGITVPPDPPAVWPDATPPSWWIWRYLYPRQDFRCGACRSGIPVFIDHDHSTNLVRGLLCATCNSFEARCTHHVDCYNRYHTNPPGGDLRWIYPHARQSRRAELARFEQRRERLAQARAECGLPAPTADDIFWTPPPEIVVTA